MYVISEVKIFHLLLVRHIYSVYWVQAWGAQGEQVFSIICESQKKIGVFDNFKKEYTEIVYE